VKDEETQEQEDEISFIDLFAVLWRWKVMIVVITLLAAIGVVVYSLISIKLPPEESFNPNVFTAKALMLIDSRSSGMSSSVSGLASLLGASLSSGGFSNSRLAAFLVDTNSMIDSIVDEFNLIEKYNITSYPKTSSRGKIKGFLKAGYDNNSGVFTISFTHIDPVFAKDVVNYCTVYLEKRFDELGLDKNKIEKENLELNIANAYNEILKFEEESRRLEQSVASAPFSGRLPAITTEINRINLELETQRQVYTQLKVQYELLKVSMASEKPVFQILEMAEVPEKKSGPKRDMLCIIVTLAAGFFAIFLAFVLNAIINIRNDPIAMAKLKGTRTNEKR
jgi:uncharacterized protein involved in exopolysaccharide biosynthesis